MVINNAELIAQGLVNGTIPPGAEMGIRREFDAADIGHLTVRPLCYSVITETEDTMHRRAFDFTVDQVRRGQVVLSPEEPIAVPKPEYVDLPALTYSRAERLQNRAIGYYDKYGKLLLRRGFGLRQSRTE